MAIEPKKCKTSSDTVKLRNPKRKCDDKQNIVRVQKKMKTVRSGSAASKLTMPTFSAKDNVQIVDKVSHSGPGGQCSRWPNLHFHRVNSQWQRQLCQC